jgi:hypothetical protein
LENYGIIPEEERKLFDRKVAQVADFGKRREMKINQYKKEKDLQARIEVGILLLTCLVTENV